MVNSATSSSASKLTSGFRSLRKGGSNNGRLSSHRTLRRRPVLYITGAILLGYLLYLQVQDLLGFASSDHDEPDLRKANTPVLVKRLEAEWQWAAHIDLVYTWVNGSESRHIREIVAAGGQAKGPRDRDNGEFKYGVTVCCEGF